MAIRVFVPRDSGALSMGADERGARHRGDFGAASICAHPQRFARHVLARTSGRGRDIGRAASPMGRCRRATCRGSLLQVLWRRRVTHSTLGPTEEIPYFETTGAADVRARRASPTRSASTTTSRTAAIEGLARALTMTPAEIVQEVTDSGLRGRGGAAFPTGSSGRRCSIRRSRRST